MKSTPITLKRRAFLATAGAIGALAGLDLRRVAMAASGGTLTLGRPVETSHLDPHASQLSTSWHIQHMIFDSLVTFDDEFNLQPSLASAWEWEGNNLTFTLRSGVKFANGREMTTDDVIGSLERAFVAKGNPWPLLLRNRTGMSASGNTVTIAFDGPNNVALASLAATLVCILPMKEVNEGTVDPTTDMYMASGPYRVVEHIANDRWVLEANPHYWGGQPKADKVVVRTIPSSQGLVAALREGSIDGAMFYGDPDASALLAGIPNVSYSILGTTDFAYLGLNALREDSPFTDKRVRQAVALVIDRQQIIDFALAGQSTPTYGWTQWGLTDDTKLPLYERNVEKAKALMAEAKPARTTLNMLVRGGNSVNEAVAQVIKQNLAEIGLDCQLESVDGGVWAKRVWGTRPVSDFDLTNSNYTGFSHPLITAHWWAPDLSGFTKGYVPVNETYTAALNKAVLGGGDEAAVNASLQELYGMLNEEAVKIPLCVVTDTIAWRSDRVNMTPSKKEEQNDVFSGVETWEMLT